MYRRTIYPCPHCGGEGAIQRNYAQKLKTYMVFVRCSMCGATGKVAAQKDEGRDTNTENAEVRAIAAWNTRTGGVQLNDRIAMDYLREEHPDLWDEIIHGEWC